MSVVTISIRDGEREIHGRAHREFVDAVMGALASEPATIAELEEGLERFHHAGGEPQGLLCFARPGLCLQPAEGGLVVVDLRSRLVASIRMDEPPEPVGQVEYHDSGTATGLWLGYQLADDWLFVDGTSEWRELAAVRRGGLEALDARRILDEGVLEFVARESLGLAGSASEAGGRSEFELIADIHARWLVTPRDDLAGRAPRDVLLERHEFIAQDLASRQRQWMMVGACPQGLRVESAAYRSAGFGTHEIVLYYDLVRHLLYECWARLASPPSCQERREDPRDDRGDGGPLSAHESIDLDGGRSSHQAEVEPNVDSLVRWLAGLRDQWRTTPQESLCNLTPSAVIELERQRVPLTVDPRHAILDHDCPLCQMMADHHRGGPMFWELDTCHVDSDFAFSFYRTREEWEREEGWFSEMPLASNAGEPDAATVHLAGMPLASPSGASVSQDRGWGIMSGEVSPRVGRREEPDATRGGAPADLESGGGESGDDLVDEKSGEPVECSLWKWSWSRPGLLDESYCTPAVLMIVVGAHLAELVEDLRQAGLDSGAAARLTGALGGLRDGIRDRTQWLVAANVERMCDTLDELACVRGELAEKCGELQREIVLLGSRAAIQFEGSPR